MSLNTTQATVSLQVNGKQAEETLQNLKKHALDLNEAMARAAAAGDKVTLQKLRKEMRDTQRQIKQIESSTMQVENVLRRLDKTSPRELQKTLSVLTKQLDYIERGSDAWDAHVKKIQRVKDEIAKVNGEMAKSQTWLERINNKWQEWQTVAMGAAAAATGIVMAGKSAVNMYAEMGQEMANVRKYTGMSADEVEHLNQAFRQIDTRTSRDDLNKLAQEAGRLGKTSEEDVLGFVKAANQINVALDDLGDGATLTLSKLTSIFGDEERLGTEQSLLAVGSVINELSQNCTASAPYLASFAQRMAGVASTAEMTIPQVMSFAAVLDANGQACEMSASNLGKLIMQLYKDPGKIAQQTGMKVDEFTAALKRSTNEGVLMFLDHIHAMGTDEGLVKLAPLFKDLGMDSVRLSQVLSTLANNTDMLRWELGEAENAFSEATSITKEYTVQNTTVQAGIEKARKGFQEMAIALGEELVPVMSHVMSSTSATMRVMLQTIRFIKEHSDAILSLAAALATYTIAVNLAIIKEKTHTALVAAKSVAMHAHRVVVLAASAAYAKLTGNTTRANAAMKMLHATMKMNPWGLLAAAIVAAVTALALYIKKQSEITLAQKSLDDIKKHGTQQLGEEEAKLRTLIATAENERLSLDKRKAAVAELNRIIPNYNAQLDETTGKYTANKQALDQYLTSLAKQYEIEGARAKLAELGAQKADLNLEKKTATENLEIAKAQSAATATPAPKGPITSSGGAGPAVVSGSIVSATDLAKAEGKLSSIEKKLQDIKAAEQAIFDVYGEGLSEAAVAPTPQVPGSPTVDVSGAGADEGAASKNKFQAEDDWREREEALNRIAYAKGEEQYDAYVKRMLAIEVEYNEKKLAHTDLVGNEQVTIEAKYQEALKKQRTNAIEGTVEQENEQYRELQAILQQKYVDGEVSARQYQADMELLELEHQRRLIGLYEEGSKERQKAEQQYQQTQLRQQQKHVEEQKRIQEQFRQQYFTKAYQVEDKEGYQNDLKNLQLVHAQMLKAAGNNNKARLRVERAFLEAKYQLARKYNVKEAKDMESKFRNAIDDSVEWLKSDAGQAMTQSFSTIVNGMGEIFSGLSTLIQAELDIQTAGIERKYDAAISAAEGNKYQEVQLEQQKQKEIGKAKSEANKKMFAMQVMQAVAQTAMSAISAYSSAAAIPVVGFIMAPIAAAMAVAAGAIQIASIKKQQQASEAQGYAEGGFTPPGDKYKEVGVVHAGEWVASQELLANPTARAMINTLDYAQRTNTIGSLKAEDVSKTITAPTVIAQAQSDGTLTRVLEQTTATLDRYSETMHDLTGRLKEPFVTVNTVAGDTGIKQAQDEYEQLMRNKTPKSRR